MRTFLAVEASDEVRAQVGRLISELAQTSAHVKWVEPANLHLTLKFFGDICDEDVSRICSAVTDAVAPISAFDCPCQGIGAFPHLGRPRTIWAGMPGCQARMAELSDGIEQALAALGFPRERRAFHPHLTLGRVREGRRLGPLTALLRQHSGISLGIMDVSTVIFFSSQLLPTGPLYTALARFALSGV